MSIPKPVLLAFIVVLSCLLVVVSVVLKRSQSDGKHWERLVPSQSKSSAGNTNLGNDSISNSQPTPESPKWEFVSEVQVLGKMIRVGDSADDVYATLTKDYQVAAPTVTRDGEGLRVTQHYLVQGSHLDITFERPGNWYVATAIRVKNK